MLWRKASKHAQALSCHAAMHVMSHSIILGLIPLLRAARGYLMSDDVHLMCLQEGGSMTDQAKESAEALKEKTKDIAGQAAEGLKNAAGTSTSTVYCH